MHARYQHLHSRLAICALCLASAISMALLAGTASAHRARSRHGGTAVAHLRRHGHGHGHGPGHRRTHRRAHSARSQRHHPRRTLVIEGAGDGHGVGMSQWGALGYAEHGWSYTQILAHYYTGTAIGRVSRKHVVKVLVGRRVKRVPIERYVRGVVAAEMPSSWPQAALEAQAVASRTYAVTDHAGGKRFDVYDDTRSQVYGGRAAETPQTNLAVKATQGQIVTYEGRPAITFFFASSGGRTEDVQDSFLGAPPQPWLRGVEDPYDGGPLHRWTVRIGFHRAAKMLRGLVKGSFEGIEVIKRGYSPRIVSAYVLASHGRTEVSGPALAGRLGLYDAWAHFSVAEGGRLRREPDLSGRKAGGGRGGGGESGGEGSPETGAGAEEEGGGSEPTAGPGGSTIGDPAAVGAAGGAVAP